ncbi:BLUF domain-containing protein [Brevundimonas staleyi]|uniref:BLUF domain-containing protein n=1 Tax=Brevundimonas staleyi TaxID=74326 RepID=A0ABW0FPD6_9CAUL
MSLEQLVYISRSNIPLASPLDVADILEVSSRNNGAYRVTGALTYSGDRFIQLLEGPPDALDWLVDRLRHDPRHRDFDILDRMTIRERAFPEWSMLFPTLTPVSETMMAKLLADGRRHAPAYRHVLLTMAREFRRSVGGY